jgi:TonB family protein
VLPNATVRLAAIGSDAVLETTTDASGTFRFEGVPAADHLLSARHVGFSTVRQRVRVAAGQSVDLALILPVGTLQETITVSGAPGTTAGTIAAAARPARPAAASTPAPCTPSEAGGQIVPPRKLRDVKPRYPQSLVDEGVTGTVLLQARIGPDGKVNQVEPVSSVRTELEEAAIAAVSQWEFSPTLLNCQPVEVRMFVSVTFTTER